MISPMSFKVSTAGMFGAYKENIINKMKNGENEPTFQIGSQVYTESDWKTTLERFDEAEDTLKKDSKEQAIKRQEELDKAENMSEKIIEAYNMAKSGTSKSAMTLSALYDKRKLENAVPYGERAENGVIEYNGVTFNCDYDNNRITLGDVSDPSKCIYVSLENGGVFAFNKDNISDVKDAIGMFSGADQARILKAISEYRLEQSKLIEADEEENETVKEMVE